MFICTWCDLSVLDYYLSVLDVIIWSQQSWFHDFWSIFSNLLVNIFCCPGSLQPVCSLLLHTVFLYLWQVAFSLWRLLLFWNVGSRKHELSSCSPWTQERGLSYPVACSILAQGSGIKSVSPTLTESQPLGPQGMSPLEYFLLVKNYF